MTFPIEGYKVIDLPIKVLNGVRSEIANVLSALLPGIEPVEPSLESLGQSLRGLEGDQLNSIRLAAIESLQGAELNRRLLESMRFYAQELLGPDILVQRGVNLVIQPKGDPNPSELHRDVPGSSAFELVIWVPLVHCKNTMNMYFLDAERSISAREKLSAGEMSWDDLEVEIDNYATSIDLQVGKALIFWTGLWHGSRINMEDSTRFSLNFRIKSIFTPRGRKDPTAYFDPFSISNLTKLALKEI